MGLPLAWYCSLCAFYVQALLLANCILVNLLSFLEFWRIGWIGVVVGGAAAVGSGFGFAK